MHRINQLFKRIAFSFFLGRGVNGKLGMICAALWFPIQNFLKIKGKGKLLRLNAFGKPFEFYTEDSPDIAVLEEVFGQEEYSCDVSFPVKVIIDIGAHAGASSVYFSLKYPNASIISLEPDPRNYKKLLRNIDPYKKVVTIQAAIGDHDGEKVFYTHPSSISSSFVKRDETAKATQVKVKTLASLLHDFNLSAVDILKFDIEGGEWDMLRDFSEKNTVKVFLGEVHPDLIPVSEDKFLSLFSGYNIEKKKVGGKRYILFAKLI